MITRKKVTISLIVNFSALWALSLFLWMGRLQARAMVIWLAPLAPPYYGLKFLAERDFDVAFVSLFVTVLTIVLCFLTLFKSRLVTLIPANIMVVLYWFWSFCLIGIGV